MYCPASDIIAAELPKLSEAIIRLDATLFQNMGQVVSAVELQEFCQTSKRDLRLLTDRYASSQVIEPVDLLGCPVHDSECFVASKIKDALYCDQCDKVHPIDECKVLSGFKVLHFEPSPDSAPSLPASEPGNMKQPVRVFVSYSHDSPEHVAQILALANQFRELGIDAWIDQYDPHPPESWPLWMEQQVERADFVLIVCTERYYRRSRGEEVPGVGKGVAWESVLIRNELYDSPHANSKFIPIFLKDSDHEWLLPRLGGYTSYTLAQLKLDPKTDFEKLYRRLTNQPANPAPQLGRVEQFASLSIPSPANSRILGPQATALGNQRKLMSATNRPKVFVSHSKKDIGFVNKLIDRLKSIDVPVWFDESDILVGDSIVAKINEALVDSDYLIVVLSDESVKSRWVQNELESVLMAQASGRQIDILPVKIDDCEIPDLLKPRLYADFSVDFEKGFEQLRRIFALESKLPSDEAELLRLLCESRPDIANP